MYINLTYQSHSNLDLERSIYLALVMTSYTQLSDYCTFGMPKN